MLKLSPVLSVPYRFEETFCIRPYSFHIDRCHLNRETLNGRFEFYLHARYHEYCYIKPQVIRSRVYQFWEKDYRIYLLVFPDISESKS